MKILHSADWHLGVKNSKLPQLQQQILKEEILIKIQDFFRKAKRENFDVIFICGDLFHSNKCTQKIINIFFKEVEMFSNPVIYIQGNHDEYFDFPQKLPENFIVLNKENSKFNYRGYNFYSQFEEKFELNYKETNILLLHGHIENSADNDYIELNQFLKYKFDYIALGHVHQFKKYKKGEQVFAYSGSLLSNGFDECGDKGYLEVVMNEKHIEKINFVTFSARRYIICDCDITGLENSEQIIQNIRKKLNDIGVNQKDLVRVVLIGNYLENMEKSLRYIVESFNDYFYFELIDKSRLKIDIEKIKNEPLSFKYEFISLVENSLLSEEEKGNVCEIGLEALKGEDLPL